MRLAIEEQSQHLPSQMFSNLISRMVESGISLLNYDLRDSQYRIVGLMVLDCLLDISDEIMPERRIEIANQLRKVLENDKQNLEANANVLRIAAECIGHLARVASTTEIEFLQDFYVTNAIKWLGDMRSEARRFSGVLILTQLAINSPALIFVKRKVYFGVIWDVITDKISIIREAAAESLQAAMVVISQRENTDEYLRLSLNQLESSFVSTTSNDRVHGAMLIFSILLNSSIVPSNELLNTIRNVNLRLQDLFWEVLQRKDSRDLSIRYKVISLIPQMAATSPQTFLQSNQYTVPNNFLTYAVHHLLDVIRGMKDRSVAYIALGDLFVAMSSALRGVTSIADDVFSAIRDGFKEPFCTEALQCLGVVVRSSTIGHRYVDSDLVAAMFQGGLTPGLIKSLKIIVKSTPTVRGQVQSRLRSHITNILLNHGVHVEDAPIQGRQTRSGSRTTPKRPQMPLTPTHSMSFGNLWSSVKSPHFSPFNKSMSFSPGYEETTTTDDELVLALQVLASFDFLHNQFSSTTSSSGKTVSRAASYGTTNEGEMLLRVVREGVVRYLDDMNPAIRNAAAVTCATVLDKVVDTIETSTDGDRYLIQVIDRLLMLGVGDESQEIRANVFLSLPPSLDHVVSHSENVHCLIEALNDESFDVRAAAMSVLSRVAHYDHVHVMPLVRLTLSKLMRQLHNTKDQLLRQESVQLLQAMVRGTNILIVPYVRQVLEPLLALLDDPSSSIVGAALSTIGELAIASPENVAEHIDVLLPRLIQALNDQTSLSKQEVSIIALGKLVSSLNLVSNPYKQYPILFESIVKAIQRSEAAATVLRLEAIKTAGLLGAADGETYQKYLRSVGGLRVIPAAAEVDEEEGKESPGSLEEDDQLMSQTDKYYLSVVMRALTSILRDSSLSSHHQVASAVALRIVKFLGVNCLSQIDDLVSGMTYRFYHSDPGSGMQEVLLDHLVTIAYVVGRDLGRNVSSIVKLVCDSFHLHLQHCLDMVEVLCETLPTQEFNGVLRDVLHPMMQVMRNDLLSEDDMLAAKTEFREGVVKSRDALQPQKKTSMPNSRKIFLTISNLAPNLGEYRRQLIPVLLKILEQPGVRDDTRRDALCTVMHLARDSDDLNEFASRIIHPVIRTLNSSNVALQSCALTALSCLVCRLGAAYLPFVIPVKRKITALQNREGESRKSPQLEEYESLIGLLLKQRTLPLEPSDVASIFLKNQARLSARAEAARGVHGSLRVEQGALRTAWTLSGRTTTSDLVEWMRRLSIEFLRQSPSPILRPCAVLAKVYQPLAHELFNAAFISVWDEVFSSEASDIVDDIPLINGLETALQSSQIPGNIRHALLNLAEFMEMQDKRLPLDIQLLAKQAEIANMFAKCLHYRELEFNSQNTLPSSECIEALIIVNNQLGLRDGAAGIVQCVGMRYPHITIKPFWLEKLNRWQDAKSSYLLQAQEWKTSRPYDIPSQHESWMESELGHLRCLHALGDFDELAESAQVLKDHARVVEGQVDMYDSWMSQIQRLGANAAWMLGRWDAMESFLDGDSLTKQHDIQLENDGLFYHAVLSIHKNDFKKSLKLVRETREAIVSSVSSLLSESYSRAYRSMVTMQVLSEMEELIEYKQYMEKALAGFTLPHSYGNVKDFANAICSGRGLDGVAIDKSKEGVSNEAILVDVSTRRLALTQKWQRRLKSAPREVDVYRLILVCHFFLFC